MIIVIGALLLLAPAAKAMTPAGGTMPVGITLVLQHDTLALLTADTLQPAKAAAGKEKNKPGKPDERRQRIVSALFAFPFPFGFMGAHRIMLGSKPWIPVVYVATFGGCFGLLPMIDFCAIVFSKDIKQYENNPHIFMWLH